MSIIIFLNETRSSAHTTDSEVHFTVAALRKKKKRKTTKRGVKFTRAKSQREKKKRKEKDLGAL